MYTIRLYQVPDMLWREFSDLVNGLLCMDSRLYRATQPVIEKPLEA